MLQVYQSINQSTDPCSGIQDGERGEKRKGSAAAHRSFAQIPPRRTFGVSFATKKLRRQPYRRNASVLPFTSRLAAFCYAFALYHYEYITLLTHYNTLYSYECVYDACTWTCGLHVRAQLGQRCISKRALFPPLPTAMTLTNSPNRIAQRWPSLILVFFVFFFSPSSLGLCTAHPRDSSAISRKRQKPRQARLELIIAQTHDHKFTSQAN